MTPYRQSPQRLIIALLLVTLESAFNAEPAIAQDIQIGPFTLPPGETATIEFEAEIADPFPVTESSVSNQGTVTFGANGGMLTDDPDTPAIGDPTVTPVIQPIDADVSITKSGPTEVTIGGSILYTLMVSNSGPDEAPNVVVEDTLPAGVTFVNASLGCGESSGTVTCTIASIAAMATVNLTIEVTAPDVAGMLTNTATVDSGATDDMPGNNSAVFATNVRQQEADLRVAKSDSPDPVQPGAQLVYTVSTTNDGPDPAENVVATDSLPAGVTFLSTSGCQNDPNGVAVCALGTIPSGDSRMYTITVTVDSDTPDGILTNDVSVDSDTFDPDTTNNTAKEETTVAAEVLCAGLAPTMGCTVNGQRKQLCQGTPGNDIIIGTNADSVIHGLGGDDYIIGGNGHDTVCGGEGNDMLDGNNGNDRLLGGNGDDTLNGKNGNDRLFGENGDDTLNGNNGNDAMDGGAGNDTCNGGIGADQAVSCEVQTSVP